MSVEVTCPPFFIELFTIWQHSCFEHTLGEELAKPIEILQCTFQGIVKYFPVQFCISELISDKSHHINVHLKDQQNCVQNITSSSSQSIQILKIFLSHSVKILQILSKYTSIFLCFIIPPELWKLIKGAGPEFSSKSFYKWKFPSNLLEVVISDFEDSKINMFTKTTCSETPPVASKHPGTCFVQLTCRHLASSFRWPPATGSFYTSSVEEFRASSRLLSCHLYVTPLLRVGFTILHSWNEKKTFANN